MTYYLSILYNASVYYLSKLYTALVYFHLFLPLSLFGLILILYLLIRRPIKPTCKINNFFMTYVFAGIYIMCFIVFLIFIRILQYGKFLDLKILFKAYILLFVHFEQCSFYVQIIYILGGIILILLWILIFYKIRNRLARNLWKIYYYKKNIYMLTKLNNDEKFKELCFHISMHYTFFNFCRSLTHQLNKIITIRYTEPIERFFRYLPHLILLFLVFFECYNNNFILHYTLKYLIIYMVYNLWYRLSFIIHKSNGFLDEILIERAYGEPNILYVNLTENDEKLLETYILEPHNYEKLEKLGSADYIDVGILCYIPIYYYRRFVWISGDVIGLPANQMIYLNKLTLKYFEEVDIKRENGRIYVKDEIGDVPPFNIDL